MFCPFYIMESSQQPLFMWGNDQDLASKSGFSEFSIWALNYYIVF